MRARSPTARRWWCARRATAPPTRELWDAGRARRARADGARGRQRGDRVGIWSPNRYEWVVVQYATARIGAILVNINPAYKTAELEYALNQSGVEPAHPRARVPQADYVGHARPRSAAAARSCARRWCSRTAGRRCCATPAAGDRGASSPSARARCSSTTRSTSSTRRARPGSPRAPRSRTTTSSTTASSSARRCATPSATASASRCPSTTASAWCSATSPAPRTARAWSSPARPSTRCAVLETVQAERCTALYGVPTMFIAELDHPRFAEFDFSTLRTGIMAGSPCPVEVMKQVQSRDAHARGHHLLRHDRDLAGLHAERHRRSAREARRHRGPRPSARRDQDRRPRDGRDRPARRRAASSARAATA